MHPFSILIWIKGIWFVICSPFFPMVCNMYDSSNVMLNAISHIIMFHTPRTMYTICNYIKKCIHVLYTRSYSLMSIVLTFVVNPLPPSPLENLQCFVVPNIGLIYQCKLLGSTTLLPTNIMTCVWSFFVYKPYYKSTLLIYLCWKGAMHKHWTRPCVEIVNMQRGTHKRLHSEGRNDTYPITMLPTLLYDHRICNIAHSR